MPPTRKEDPLVRYYLTTAIDYVNSRPHLGTAYEKVTADVIARYHRALGRDVHFLMGNDEHSQKVERAARDQGLTPMEWCDRMELQFRQAWDSLDIAPDDFIRTSQERHKTAVRHMVQAIHERGFLYEGTYEGWYCVGCEAFKNEADLVEGKCPDHKTRTPDWLKERNWFFKLSAFRASLLAHYEAHPEFVQPSFRRNELLSLLNQGLEDVSVSRSSVSWGVPFPFDPGAVVYVWFDALINYIAGAGYPDDKEAMARWWPADLHLIGKDITRFHCVIWPAMLMAAGLPLPRTVFGHGFINMGADRMSKSSGVTTDPQTLVSTYGSDAIRYYLCSEASFGQDLTWSEERLKIVINSDLANGLGNLASRVISMIVKYQGGRLGEVPASSAYLDAARLVPARYREAMEDFDLRGALALAMGIVQEGNIHVDRTQPFILAKDPNRAKELEGVLAELCHGLLIAACLLFPFMPKKMGQLYTDLCGEAIDPLAAVLHAPDARLSADRILAKGTGLFPRVE